MVYLSPGNHRLQPLEQGHLGGPHRPPFFFLASCAILIAMQADTFNDPDRTAMLECELVSRVARHEKQALAELYELTVSRVYAVVMRVLRHSADAEEVIGDVYLQIWEQASNFRSERGSVMAWMNTLAWSRAVDKHRKNRRDAFRETLHPDASGATYMECEELSAEQLAESWSSSRAIQRALGELTEIQQQVLRLAYTGDLSHQDIARALNLPLGTVKSHCRRGLAALRDVLVAKELG